MTPVQDYKYSHDVAVASITSYCTFLERINSDDLFKFEYPPPSGWPQFKRELFPQSPEAMVELLRLELMDATRVIEYGYHADNCLHYYLDQKAQSNVLGLKWYSPDFELPPYVVQLTDGGRYSYILLVDTEQGTIIVTKDDNEYLTGINGDGGCYLDYHPEERADDDDDEIYNCRPWCWKRAPAIPIEESFEMCKEQFRNMNWFAIVDGNGCSAVH